MKLGMRCRTTGCNVTASGISFLALCVLLLCGSRGAAQAPDEDREQRGDISMEEAVVLAGERLIGRIPSLRGSAVHRLGSGGANVSSFSSPADGTDISSQTADSGLADASGSGELNSAADEGADNRGPANSTVVGDNETNKTSPSVPPDVESESYSPNSTASPVTNCFYGHNFCQCKRRDASDLASGCLAAAGVDSATGRKLCRPVDCLPKQGYVCDCEGDELCRNDRTREQLALTVDVNESPAMEGFSPSQSFFYCDDNMILGTVEPVEEADSLDSFTAVELRNHVTEHTAAWNATHCACTPKINLVSHTTCFDLFREAPAPGGPEADLCTVRSCRIDPDEFVCDMMTGTSLCERFLVYAERYRESPGVPRPTDVEEHKSTSDDLGVTKVVACHKEGGATERPRCVSSCP